MGSGVFSITDFCIDYDLIVGGGKTRTFPSNIEEMYLFLEIIDFQKPFSTMMGKAGLDPDTRTGIDTESLSKLLNFISDKGISSAERNSDYVPVTDLEKRFVSLVITDATHETAADIASNLSNLKLTDFFSADEVKEFMDKMYSDDWQYYHKGMDVDGVSALEREFNDVMARRGIK